MVINKDAPFYVKLAFKFLVIFFICFFISVSQNILVPFAFAVLLSVMLLPLTNFFEKSGFSKVLSITLSLLCSVLFISLIVYLLSTQIARFVDDIPSIKKHLNDHFISFQKWIKTKLHVSFTEQNEYLNNAAEKLKDSGTGYLSDTFFSITEVLMLLILMPIYTFLLLYYRNFIRRFLFAVFPDDSRDKVAIVIKESKVMIHNYMLGLLIEIGIVAAANSIGLALLGIKYAIFFGVLAAVLNIIPYIGMFTATAFTVLVTLSTSNSTSAAVWVVVVMYSIHIIDVNILMPKIVGSKVRINALISILGVVIGGALTGLSGLFLSVPAVALIKIICDQVDDLKPWGTLMGDESPLQKGHLYNKLKNFKRKKSTTSSKVAPK
jgi:predicted PurR-regulated permease PerM